MILIDWITSASCKIKVVRGGKHLWHKHFKRFGFGRQLFNTHMGIYECLVSAQLESARHLAKKRVEPKRATPKNRHRNMAGSSSTSSSAALENLATVWRLLNGAGRSSNSLDAPPAVPAPSSLAPSIISFNSRCPDSCFKCFVSGSLVFLAYEKEKCRLGDVFMLNDLCLAARSVKVIEWEMLSAAGAGAGRGKGATKCLGQCAAAAGRHVSQIQPCC